MKRTLPLVLALVVVGILIPTFVSARPAASLSAGRSLVVASSSPANAYAAGISVVATAPVAGDLSIVGGSIVSTAAVAGDESLFAGSVNVRAPVQGDLRTGGGSITIDAPIGGDLIALGFSVHSISRAEGSVLIGGVNVLLEQGAGGPVTIYGNDVSLAGQFGGDVSILGSGRITLAPNTIIKGALIYEAPEPANIPSSATIIGGVTYRNATYLPDPGTSRVLAVISIGFFLFVRILGALILAGLLAGLFPRFAETIAERVHTKSPRSTLLTMLLGFGILVATPVLVALLLLTFVGIGLAFLLLILYALLATLAVLYSGILLGTLLARRFAHRDQVLWRDGVLGMLVFSFIALVPVFGFPVLSIITMFVAGSLLQLFFNFAFPHKEY